ncbi:MULTISPECIES: ATP-binding cassette domain-containing protein [unclassified Duganella]|uniref:ABC transporter ATP-binding protein n=1 Tax=unclassified Duganella TaxID=2636909 RepID=UPI00088DFC22|nr:MULTISPECIES: ATP-binding cassette domain-containing protein [unclassified Duganella]SDH24892.1 ABC-2 type transport system ATP-binding protein [Duganella sp. OV458]SDK43334.1 ABC-2 type transport system ATP-binding protein [Duganella sp. OV510]
MELRIEQLDFEYASHPLFQQYSLALQAGVTWLRGENGAGKTTLLKLAGGALTPHSGKIWLDDIEIHAQPLTYRLRCYYCGGDTPQLPWLTVREMLDLHIGLYPGTDEAQLNAQLAAFHLMPTLDQPVTTLSLGQHKKMQLALALSLPVRLLLIDEPFNGLDVDAVAYLRQQLSAPQRLASQLILLTSHLDPQLPLTHTVQL